MLAKVRVTSIIRYSSAAVVDGGIMIMIYRFAAIVGSSVHDKVAISDG